VTDAIEAGRLPRGGPSDAAARDLIGEMPTGYWEGWSNDAAARIRAQPVRCCCHDGGQLGGDGRCQRCHGWDVP
jgi:hypothetical protein